MREAISSRSGGRMLRLITMHAGMLFAALIGSLAWADDMVEVPDRPPVEAPPSWIARVDADPADPKNSQLEYLLIDRQLRVEDNGSSAYSRFVMHLGNQSAVDDESHVQIVYRPSNERIILHSLVLRRDGHTIDQLQRARISTLRRELDLEQGIIDGELTTSMVLEDVRVGDVLEYSYTRFTGEDGLNTAFSDSFTTQWSIPVRQSHLRFLHPATRRMSVKNTNASEQPTTRMIGNWRELVWQWRGLTSIPQEDNRPGWHVHYPYIQFSETQSWRAVARWARPLYPKVQLSPELQALVAQLKASGATRREQIVEALRFVQDDIRYTGIEIGVGGYKPQPPEVVLKRRFGDCKEKAYLLVTLLHALGVDARPALVNTYRKQAARDLLPSAAAFNHMIVRIAHEGKVYWFDATSSLQGGALDTIQQAHFGAALVIDDAGQFETIPAALVDAPEQIVVERFDLKAGVFEKGTMKVETTYQGGEADRMRRFFARTSREDVTRQYLNFYKDDYPTISVDAPYTVADDRESNKLVVVESYALEPAFAQANDDDNKHYFEFNAHPVQLAATAPKTIVRTSPLRLNHPTRVRYEAVVQLPEPWSIDEFEQNIDSPGFTYRASVRYQQDTVTAEYDFQTLLDDVPAAGVQEHVRKLEAVRNNAYYYLSYAPGTAAEPAPFKLSNAMLFALLGGMVGGGLLIRRLWRYDSPRFPKPAPAHAPQGIGGWLLLPALGTIVLPFLLGYTIYAWRDYFDAGVWANLGSGQDAVLAHWGKIGLFCVLLLAYVLFVVSVFMNYLLFKRQRGFPLAYSILLWLGLAWEILTNVSLNALGAQDLSTTRIIATVIGDFLSAILWTSYMLLSDRVRATFVNTQPAAQPSPVAAEPITAT